MSFTRKNQVNNVDNIIMMLGGEKRTNRRSVQAGAEFTGDKFRCTRRGFVGGVGSTGTAAVLGGVPDAATAGRSKAAVQPASRLSQRWSTELTGTVQDYLVEGDSMYVATENGTVRTLDVETGREINQIEFDESVRPYGLAKDGQYLAVGLANSRLKIISSGALSEEQTITFSGDLKGITARRGAAFLATSSAVQRVSLPDGEPQWRFDSGSNSPVWTTSEGIAVHTGKFHVLNEDDGETVWNQNIGGAASKTGNWLQASHFWGLAELESHLFTATPRGGYDFLDKFSGEQLWKTGGGGNVNRPVVSSEGVIHQESSSIISRNFDSGDPQWETDIVNPHARGMGIYDGSLVVFGKRKSDDANVMMALDPSSRALVQEREVAGVIGLVSTIGNAMFGVNLETDEMQVYLPEGAQINIPERPTATPTPTTDLGPTPTTDLGSNTATPTPPVTDSFISLAMYALGTISGFGGGYLIVGDYLLPGHEISDTEKNRLFVSILVLITAIIGIMVRFPGEIRIDVVRNSIVILIVSTIAGLGIRIGSN
jgi:outer membrane protein assembly factor BamB